MTTTKRDDVWPGGLMRCCTGSLRRHLATDHECTAGETVSCETGAHPDNMILAEDGWRWNRKERDG